jgi:hypothetical protein
MSELVAGGFTDAEVATLRGMYQENNSDSPAAPNPNSPAPAARIVPSP